MTYDAALPLLEATTEGTVDFGEWKPWYRITGHLDSGMSPVIAFVLTNADAHAKIGGLVWLGVGVVIVIGLRISGRSTELMLEG